VHVVFEETVEEDLSNCMAQSAVNPEVVEDALLEMQEYF